MGKNIASAAAVDGAEYKNCGIANSRSSHSSETESRRMLQFPGGITYPRTIIGKNVEKSVEFVRNF